MFPDDEIEDPILFAFGSFALPLLIAGGVILLTFVLFWLVGLIW